MVLQWERCGYTIQVMSTALKKTVNKIASALKLVLSRIVRTQRERGMSGYLYSSP